jgi:hypothetical protein
MRAVEARWWLERLARATGTFDARTAFEWMLGDERGRP